MTKPRTQACPFGEGNDVAVYRIGMRQALLPYLGG